MALRSMMPRQPTGQKWAICRNIVHHLSKWQKGEDIRYPKATEDLGEAILMINEAVRLLNPQLAIPGTEFVPKYKTVMEQRSQAVGHYDGYLWAGQPLINMLREFSRGAGDDPIASDQTILQVLYETCGLIMAAREGFRALPGTEEFVAQTIALFEQTALKVAV